MASHGKCNEMITIINSYELKRLIGYRMYIIQIPMHRNNYYEIMEFMGVLFAQDLIMIYDMSLLWFQIRCHLLMTGRPPNLNVVIHGMYMSRRWNILIESVKVNRDVPDNLPGGGVTAPTE